ncbi:MAG TPA: glycogen debranching protein [Verrucomicrobiae bacterium]|nr:glycogen debranching protein [Verrucomicrobiae bacterium]
MNSAFLAALPLFFSLMASSQSNGQSDDRPPALAKFPFENSVPLKIVREAVPSKPFTVVGPRGAILGRQDGSFEAWIFPWKIFANLRISAEMQDYPVPIDVNDQAAVVEVRPDHTTITFSHANFTLREVLFAPHNAPDGAGALAFFQIEALRPLTLTFQFVPEMKPMWPAPSDDHPSPEWVKAAGGGFYALHLNFPNHAAAIEIPGAEPGIMNPYQERPKTYPLQFVLHFDPAHDADKFFPLLLATADTAAGSQTDALAARLADLLRSFQTLYEQTGTYFRNFLSKNLVIETPDKQFDEAFAWAEISIDQLKVQTTPSHQETALVAGFYGSGDSARPGFGWYFGRDALWTLYAVNSYGDFQLTRDQLAFLLRRQSPEGKIIHEWAQTADLVNWKSLPYAFASADATPLLLMAANDYFQISGDVTFVNMHWDSLEKAWEFERSHDSDGDGIYENTEGSGWVESWPPGMPHQEIYLAALDQQASTAFSNIARATGHAQLADDAQKRAAHIAQQVEKEYFLPDANFYAFSRNADGTLDASPTIYPAVAAWDGTFSLSRASEMLSRWASQEFSTDWGTRDLSPVVSFYDPISYHQGSVWPLFTGWVSLSEYRYGRSLAGYAHLMQNADLTWAQDLGAVTELLSGEFFRWFGRSTSHQLWSSAMVVTPTVRGMFGLEWSASEGTLTITPSLPAQWSEAKIAGVPIGQSRVGVELRRNGSALSVRLTGDGSKAIKLRSRAGGARIENGELRIPLPAAEVGIEHGLPEAGAITSQMKILDQRESQHALQLRLSALANSNQQLFLRLNDPKIHLRTDGAEVSANFSQLQIHFPPGAGYVEKVVTLSW